MRVRIFQSDAEIIDDDDAVSVSKVIKDVVKRGKLDLNVPFTIRHYDDYYACVCKTTNVPAIPVIPRIDAAILAAIEGSQGCLNMNLWHGEYSDIHQPCGTTHCRAGWAIMLAGEPGFQLERTLGADVAGTLLYLASRPGEAVPDFFCETGEAVADIRECAARQ